MTFPASDWNTTYGTTNDRPDWWSGIANDAPLSPTGLATLMVGEWNRELEAPTTPLARRIFARKAVAYDEAWNAWHRIGQALEDAWDTDPFLFAQPVREEHDCADYDLRNPEYRTSPTSTDDCEVCWLASK